ncbi:hypothetical protein BGZ65_003492 [Modicella reniformis]|uniref:F-box domain-containing protein n=1 Tax=Modicella reniformis TaxID=1440133 RepID=A0A9P6IZG8_9FUNG|nr:hypothetical protein BGZ65_003492 [Modicella reniformis]
MYDDVSIFDIPHVVSSIGSYLDCRDRASCILVNKTFCDLFKPILWRELVIDQRPSLSMNEDIEPHLKQILTRNCQSTRSLTIRRSNNDGALAFIPTSCNRLKDLTVQLISDDDNSIVALITNNKDLREFSFYAYTHPTCADLEALPDALARSATLTVLRLELRWRPGRGWLKHILQNLPRNLTSVTLQWGQERVGDLKWRFSAQDWPHIYPSLEVADLSFESLTGDEVVLGQFLKRCPALRSFSSPTMAEAQIQPLIPLLGSSNLPNLTSVYLGKFGKTNEIQWRDLVMILKGRIRHFAASFEYPLTNIASMLSRNWSDTLESLRFLWISRIFSRDVQLILTTCSKLKQFDCMWTLADDGSQEDDDKELDMKAWTCSGLEELHLMFADNRRSLTKLKVLTIGWHTKQDFSENSNLDMTLQSGLGHMANLKALKTLDINFLPQVNIGLSEVQWIAENWPALRLISGLRPEPELDHITWLCSKRPKLVIY